MRKIVLITALYSLLNAEDYDNTLEMQKARRLNGQTHNGVSYDYVNINNQRQLEETLASKGGSLGKDLDEENGRKKIVHVINISNVKLKKGQNLGVIGENLTNKEVTNVITMDHVDTHFFGRNPSENRHKPHRSDHQTYNADITNRQDIQNSTLIDINTGVKQK